MSEGAADRGAAIALSYQHNNQAPRVVAKGYGVVAEAIIARAREAGVYIHDSPTLVNLLMQVDLDSQIPPQLYVAVAELLAWIYHLEAGLDAAGQEG
ncbi:EscU/YscU/HrcU family type III secretion system export apparatus switch protein [Cupriavidus consociatus]|uniref:EscU/YscU/HrcU family type III secretion system export apparatus switch protein n=1 Tax=Cupriavidus consociatus TaxID=2821357 RepID=UPI001AE972AF|nr:MULTISPECIES: EscU/YscU/HrcU family type III secretion system export apparatus switch protein [unclassified Cupriavidus]MBP0619900.1 EscU/YscU/HrcU family type III secretion system export apparatus switch protein [Cupriavidus sp. LEh25]MDK2656555.1 EscU/YscU/HrcU family type III secretion system export apparatus switch protein [Cupriavidus sp. LEh21]